MSVVHAKQAFAGRNLANRRLTGPGSEKDTRHCVISLQLAPVTYLPGDALGIAPKNDDVLVEGVLRRLSATGDEQVTVAHGTPVALHHALSHVFNLTTPSRALLELMGTRGASDLSSLLDRSHAEQLKTYLNARNDAHDVLDVLEEHPAIHLTPDEFVGTLRKLTPRLYSIASSLRAHPDEVHLIVVSVRYTVRGRERLGVASTWLAERFTVGTDAAMYLQNQQKHFAMPADPNTPMIMIGPGTGLAPFRAFLEERQASGAKGPNWLFFGEQRRATDFLFEEELTGHARAGRLRLDLAFSRDQPEKIYVQHRLREHARDVWQWLENGAEIFVCGDKQHMAADVDQELHQIVESAGGRTPEQAREYMAQLTQAKRYKRDVY